MAQPTATTPVTSPSHAALHNFHVDVRMFGAVGDGTTDDTAAIQAAIDAAPAGGSVYFPRTTSYYKLTADLTITASRVLIGPGELRQTTGGQAGFTVTAPNVTFRGLTLVGPQAASYVAGEKAIDFTGASAASPLTDVRVEDCHIYTWGRAGIEAKWANRCHFNRNTIRDIGYGGILCLSCIQGEACGNVIEDVDPGTSGNGYGITLSRASTNDIGTDPRCSEWVVVGNTISDIPLWEALDTHGGSRITFADNTVYNCRFGVAVGSSDNASSIPTWAPLDVSVIGNTVDSAVTDGSATYGITFSGAVGSLGAPVETATGSIVGNVIRNYGAEANALAGGIRCRDTEALTIAGNFIYRPSPAGINLDHDNYGFSVTGNTVVDAWSNTAGAAWGVRLSSTFNNGHIGANSWRDGSLAGPTYILTRGVDVNGASDCEIVMSPNFSDAATYLTDTNAQAIGFNLTGTDVALLQKNQNAITGLKVKNTTSGTLGSAQMQVDSASSSGQLAAFSSAWTGGIGSTVADYVGVTLNSDATGLALGGASSGHHVRFFAGSTTEKGRFDSTGLRMSTSNSAGPYIVSGSGSPESVVTAPVGSLYMRTDGGVDTTLYTKTSGSGNTGWTAVDNV